MHQIYSPLFISFFNFMTLFLLPHFTGLICWLIIDWLLLLSTIFNVYCFPFSTFIHDDNHFTLSLVIHVAFSSRWFVPIQLATCSMQPSRSQQKDVEPFGQQRPYTCMSSAYWCADRPWRSTTLTSSAVYIMNRSGPSMDPETRRTGRFLLLPAVAHMLSSLI